ncbi:MAG: oligosaccharide flippase family protein [Saccharofermentanales bacterium]
MYRFVVTDTVRYTSSKTIMAGVSLLTAILLSHFLTLNVFGTYSQILLTINLATAVFMTGLPAGIDFFLAKASDAQDRQKFISVYYTVSTALGFLTGLVLVLSVSSITDYFANPLIGRFVYILAVLPWTMIVMSGIGNLLVAYHRAAHLMYFRIANGAVLLLAIAAAEWLELEFSVYMLIFVTVESIFTLMCYVIIKKTIHEFRIDFDKDIFRNILAYSLPVGLASVTGFLNIEFGKLFTAQYFSTSDMAIYCNASREMPFTIIALSITTVLMPKLAALLKKGSIKKCVALWGSSVTLSYMVLCYFAVVMFVLAPELITLLYSAQYLPGAEVFRIYSIVLLLRVTYCGIILHSVGRSRFIIYSSLASLAANMLFCYIFYNIFGFIGPAIATLASIALLQLIQLVSTSRHISFPFGKLFPWKLLLYITMANIALGAAFTFLKGFLTLEAAIGQTPETLLLVLAWTIAYALLIAKHVRSSWHTLKNTK